MKFYHRKQSMSNMFFVFSLIISVFGMMQFLTGANFAGIILLLIVLLTLYHAFLFRNPYIGLGEGKIIFRNGLHKKEIMLKDVISFEINRNMIMNYNQDSATKKYVILLTFLKEKERERFIKDIKWVLAKVKKQAARA